MNRLIVEQKKKVNGKNVCVYWCAPVGQAQLTPGKLIIIFFLKKDLDWLSLDDTLDLVDNKDRAFFNCAEMRQPV